MHNVFIIVILLSLVTTVYIVHANDMDFAYETLSYINKVRYENGLSQLEYSAELSHLALWYSKICANKQVLQHDLAKESDYVLNGKGVELIYPVIHELLYYLYDSPHPEHMVYMFTTSYTHFSKLLDPAVSAMGVHSSHNYSGYYTVVYLGVKNG